MATSTDTENRGPSVVICNAILMPLMTLCIIIKYYNRFFVTTARGWDDVCVALAYVFSMVLCVSGIVQTRYGLGRHISTVSHDHLVTLLKYNFVSELAYICSFVASKLSFAFLYLRIFPSDRVRYASYTLITILVAQLVEEMTVVLSQCVPLQKAWNPTLPGKCLDLLSFFYVAFAIKLITDITLFCLPIPSLMGLRIGLAKKIGVTLMLSLGLLVCIISIIRATFLRSTITDFTFIVPPEENWSVIEVCSLVICACIPDFRPFLRLLNVFPSEQHSNSKPAQRSSSYQLGSRNKSHKAKKFASSKNLATFITSIDNESQAEILEEADKDEIKVTTSAQIGHGNKDQDKDLQPSFVFSNV